jgi:predicted RNase H-like HicB family nuclease
MSDAAYGTLVTRELSTDGTYVYVARHPDLPGCEAHAETVDEATDNLAEARELYIADLTRRGLTVPAANSILGLVEWDTGVIRRAASSAGFPVPSSEGSAVQANQRPPEPTPV